MKYVTYFLKQMIFPLVYLVMMAIPSLAITAIGNNLAWLKVLLQLLALALYGFIIGAVSYKDGQDAVKTRHVNDMERLVIIQTGEDRPLDLIKEYKPWKGFATGFSICVPLIILMIIQVIAGIVNPGTMKAGAIASLLYMVVFGIFKNDLETAFTPQSVYLSLIALPVFMLITGISYVMGAKKIERQYQMIEEKKRQIYGDKN